MLVAALVSFSYASVGQESKKTEQVDANDETPSESAADGEQSSGEWGFVSRSTMEGGSFSYDESGRLVIEQAFPAEFPIFDPTSGVIFVGKNGMEKADVESASTEQGFNIEKLSEDEWRIGTDVLIFEDGKLSRLRNQ